LASLGIRFIATSQGLDTDQANPTSQLPLHILAAVAKFERELIRTRVAAGMKTAKSQGKPIGRPKKIFDRAEVLRLRRQGLWLAQMAKVSRDRWYSASPFRGARGLVPWF
jgi:putative DNA-invertase from lambdoid prophage Rac